MKLPSVIQKSTARGSQGILVGAEVGEGGIKVAVAAGGTLTVGVASGNAAACRAGAQEVRKKAKTKRGKRDFMCFFGVGQLADRCQVANYLLTPEINREYTTFMEDIFKTYPHNPPHYFVPNALYIVTGAVLHNEHLLKSDKHKLLVLGILLERARHWGWDLEAWAILENHYHFIARAPENALTLEKLIRQFHSKSAVELNKLDKTLGRKVWYNYWDTCITLEKSYYARLNYVHLNPVKHGLIEAAEDYPFCSYRWFLDNADESFQNTVLNQAIDRVDVFDDFDD